MDTGRLEAFSDGVIAILITIMVLDLRAPLGTGLASLLPLRPVLLTYLLSFLYLGIYWNNHHNMFHATRRVTGSILWANLHLLFWLSLFPFTTAWIDETHFATVPVAVYGVVLMMAAVAWYNLARCLIAVNGEQSALATAFGKDRKGQISIVLYAAAIAASFENRWLALAVYVFVACLWFIPDRRIEVALEAGE
jgi:uncharacterized membrane protein